MRKLGAIVLGLVLLAVAVGAFLLATLDPNDHKASIEQWASDALARPVRIGGPIELTRSLTPTLVINDLSIGGADGTSTVSVRRAELSVVLISLLFRPLHLPLVAVDTAELDLPLQGLPAGGDGEVPRIDRITLSEITIRYRRINGSTFEGVIERATVAPAADATTLEMAGTIGTVPLNVSGTTGTAAALFAGTRDWPVKLQANLGDGDLSLDGTLDLRDGQPAFMLEAKADLPASAALADALDIPALPVEAAAKLQGDDANISVEGLVLTVGNSDLQGDLAWRGGERAKLSGKLTAKRIDLTELGGTLGDAGENGDGVVPNPPLPTPARLPADLDLDVAVEQLDLPSGEAVTDLAATAVGRPQQLDLVLVQSKLGAGTVRAHYNVRAEGSAADVAFKLHVHGLDLTSVFGDPGGGNELPKDVAVAVDLAGRGTDLHGFLSSANGPLAITTGPAVLNVGLVKMLGQSIFTAIIPDWKPSEGAEIICSVLDFEAKDGKASSTTLVIDGKHVVVGGGGAIDLASGKIDFILLPTAKNATLAPLVTPVHLAGTIADPRVVGDAGDILSSTSHLLLGIVNPLSLATPILHPDRSGDMPCRDPSAFLDGQQGPVEQVGRGAVDVIEGVGRGIGSAIEDLGKGASELLDGVTKR